jgi:hypothetical protein
VSGDDTLHAMTTEALKRVATLDVEAALREAKQAGHATFLLPATGIVDRASFFDAARATFPLDPPIIGSRSWDALSDSLWEGLHEHPARKIAILWPGARSTAGSASSEFEIALNVLADVASLLADPLATQGGTKEVAIVVEDG